MTPIMPLLANEVAGVRQPISSIIRVFLAEYVAAQISSRREGSHHSAAPLYDDVERIST